MPGWADLRTLVSEEIKQRAEEGCDVAGFAERLEAADNDAALHAIYKELDALQVKAGFQYTEPSDLAGIKAARPGKSRRWDVRIDEKLKDRILGAWLGRIAGCMLGKPIEGWTEDKIRKYLQDIGEYPLANYVPGPPDSFAADYKPRPHKNSQRGAWTHAMIDDDTNYTVLGLKIMEEKGVDFTVADIGQIWLYNLPYRHVCTAERQAYMNLVNELPIEQVPLHLNPYREWIGAQIRADFWGYCTPGWPEKAAEFAYRDAALTHVKNGIYGEMFCAAAISAALATNDVYEIIDAARNQIPTGCRLAETVADCLKWRKECKTWQEAFAKMLDTYYGKYSWVHTNNNLAIVLIALLYGWPDYEKVATISVMQGMDTDCNGATAGSIIGAALGAKALPQKWIAPLGGKLETTVIGFPMPEVEELAARTMVQITRHDLALAVRGTS